jgi:hypothetical protein
MLNALIITIVLLLIANCELKFPYRSKTNTTPHRANGEFKRKIVVKEGDNLIGNIYL